VRRRSSEAREQTERGSSRGAPLRGVPLSCLVRPQRPVAAARWGWGCRVRRGALRAAESSLGSVAGEVWGWEGGAGDALRFADARARA